MWDKWYVQSKATEVCEFRAKIPAVFWRLQMQRPHFASCFAADIMLLFYLYIQKKVNITYNSWTISYPYPDYDFYQEFLTLI